MACFICFVHKGILPCNNTGAACPETPGKTSMISPPTLKLFGSTRGSVGASVIRGDANWLLLCGLLGSACINTNGSSVPELTVPVRERTGELMKKTGLL